MFWERPNRNIGSSWGEAAAARFGEIGFSEFDLALRYLVNQGTVASVLQAGIMPEFGN